jgi:hypothetical protein
MDWFKHDVDAANDPKVLKLVRVHGWEGYGIWWRLIEMIAAEETCELQVDDEQMEAIAFAMHLHTERLREVLDFCNASALLVHKGGKLYSESLKRRLSDYNELREKRRRAANKRWGNTEDASALQAECTSNANRIEENRVERSGEEENVLPLPEDNLPRNGQRPPDNSNGCREVAEWMANSGIRQRVQSIQMHLQGLKDRGISPHAVYDAIFDENHAFRETAYAGRPLFQITDALFPLEKLEPNVKRTRYEEIYPDE